MARRARPRRGAPSRVRIAGEERWIAIEDVARYRDGVGVPPPVGVPEAFLGPAVGALDGLLARCARTHGPFLTPEPARRWGLPVGVVEDALERLLARRHAAARRVPAGRRRARVVRPGRPAAAPPAVAGAAAPRGRAGRSGRARPVPARRGTGVAAGRASSRRRRSAARPPSSAWPRSSTSSPGLPIPASVLERDVLPARVPGYQPRLLDELGALGEVAWVGRGSLGRDDGRIALFRPGSRAAPAGRRRPTAPSGPPDRATTRSASTSAGRGASFYRELFAAAGGGSDREVLDALWDLVWAGEVTNDTFAPLRALRWKRTGERRAPRAAAGPADRARPARGGRPLVARRAGRAASPPTERLHAQSARPARAARRADPRGGRGRGHRGRLHAPSTRSCARSRRPAGSGAATSSTASAPPSSRCRRARPAARRPRAGRRAGRRPRSTLLAAADPANPYGAALPWPRRGETTAGRSSARPAPTSCWSTAWRRCTSSAAASTLQTLPAADDPAVAAAARCAPWPRSSPTAGSASSSSRKVDGDAGRPSRRSATALLEPGFVAGYRGLTLRVRARR